MTWDDGPELRALAALCKHLQLVGISSELRDTLPRVAIRTAAPGVYLYVSVNTTGDAYVWNNDARQHPVTDPVGAAQQIKAFMTESGQL